MPDSSPTISIALSTYNARRFLPAQLDSILAQTRLPQQIVIGDDGSDDGTAEVAIEAAERAEAAGLDIEWTLLESRHVGLRPNMTRVIAACRGDLITICDHDDVCLPDRLERAARAFADDPRLLFLHADAELIDAEGNLRELRLMQTQALTEEEREQYRRREAFRVLIRRWMAVGATSTFRRELVELAGPVPDVWLYDGWYAHVAAAMGRLRADEEPVLRYRVHATNTSGGVRRRGTRERVRMLLAPGGERNRAMLARSETLVDGLDRLRPDVADWAYDLAREKLRHERARAGFPPNRLVRTVPVLREAATGAYRQVTRGKRDLLLDLTQPPA